MSERFKDLVKIPNQPAARLLALAGARLGVKLDAPAAAPVSEVLGELEEKKAIVDMLRMLAVALPPRERVWWACLAARDLVEAGLSQPGIVEAVEAWVFKPSDENLIRIRRVAEAADPEDETVFCAQTAMMAGGKMGPEELAGFDAPPGASEASALVMNARSFAMDNVSPLHGDYLVDRALDIARGGQGDVPAPPPPPPPAGPRKPKAPAPVNRSA